MDIRHVYREVNSAVDQITSFVVEHTGDILWTNQEFIPRSFRDILFFDLFRCIHARFV